MSRPKKQRIITKNISKAVFIPQNVDVTAQDQVVIGFDELEALRLTNIDCFSQEETAEKMGISRQLVGLLLSRVRKKITDALLNPKIIKIGEDD